jgi:hypothetical protein
VLAEVVSIFSGVVGAVEAGEQGLGGELAGEAYGKSVVIRCNAIVYNTLDVLSFF